MEIVYAAYTETGTFMLDERGVCRWAVAPPGKTHATVPEKIVGAQYVATLDVGAPGGLVDLPRVGCPMLFASVDETGRVQLVRTQPVIRFEDKKNPEKSQGSKSGPPPALLAEQEKTPARPSVPPPRASAPPRPASSRPLPSTPPIPLVRPASPSPVPPRQSMIAPKMPPAPRSPSMASINTPSACRTVPPVTAPPRRSHPTIPPPPTTDPSPPPAIDSVTRIAPPNPPSASSIQSMPTSRVKGTSTQMRRMIRGR